MDRRQRRHRLAQLRTVERVDLLLGARALVRDVVLDVHELLGVALFPSEKVDRAMPRGAVEPRAKRSRIRERSQVAVDREPDFLLHIVGAVAYDAAEIPVRSLVEFVEESRERALVPR